MNKNLYKLLLTSTFTTTTFFISQSMATDINSQDLIHGSVIDLNSRFSKNRKITELDYILPFSINNKKGLPLLNLKLKMDNKKSQEINLGLGYRYMFDKFILGSYIYFDHRNTRNLKVNGLTAGFEIMSRYLDLRANIYLPQNKRKKIEHNDNNKIVIEGTSIFALSGGHRYEYSFRGYDVEVGIPLLPFSDELIDKCGRIYVAKYQFKNKNVKNISGTRFRLTQDIKKFYTTSGNSYKLYLNAETQYDKVRKRQNYFGLGVKFTFDDNKDKKRGSLSNRMMDTIVRDVDIVVQDSQDEPTRSVFYDENNNPVKNMYFVAAVDNNANYIGKGTSNSPMSFSQLNNINLDDAVVVVTQMDNNQENIRLSSADYATLETASRVVNKIDKLRLTAKSDDDGKIALDIKRKDGIVVDVVENNKKVDLVVDKDLEDKAMKFQINTRDKNGLENVTYKTKSVTLVKNEIERKITNQISGARQDYQEEVDNLNNSISNNLINDIVNIDQITDQVTVTTTNNQVVNTGLAQQPIGTVDSQINFDDLTPSEQVLYNLILKVGDTTVDVNDPANANNEFVQRKKDYDFVKNIIDSNPGADVNSIKAIINQMQTSGRINQTQSQKYEELAENMMKFSGGASVIGLTGGQAGIGSSNTNSSDITSVASLVRLESDYGIIDGNKVISILKDVSIQKIKDLVSSFTRNTAKNAIAAGNQNVSKRYKNAVRVYFTSQNPEAKIVAKKIIDHEVEKGTSAVNKYAAAYRMLNNLSGNEKDAFTSQKVIANIYNEKILGRYNTKEAIAYITMANLDVSDIQKRHQNFTSEQIFAKQKDGLMNIIHALGDSRRAYNMDQKDGKIDVGGVGTVKVNNREYGRPHNSSNDRLYDSVSCTHGIFQRAVYAGVSFNSKVEVLYLNQSQFTNKFKNEITRLGKQLPDDKKQEWVSWFGSLTFSNLGHQVTFDNNNGTVNFVEANGEPQMPNFYKEILEQSAKRVNDTFNFLNADPKMHIIKRKDAFNNMGGASYWFDPINL